MIVPTYSAATATAQTGYVEMTAAEQDRFVTEWTDVLLSEDRERLDAMPAPEAYALWSTEFKMEAVERLFQAIDAERPEDEEALTSIEDIIMVKQTMSLYIFERDAIPEMAAPTEFSEDLDKVELGDPLGDARDGINAQIIGQGDGLAPAVEGVNARTAVVEGSLDTLDEILGAGYLGKVLEPVTLPETPEVPVDDVRAALLPYTDVAQHMLPIGGTYSLLVRSNGTDTFIRDVPFGVLIPLDIDEDGTTGLGGFDLNVGVVLDSAPGANLNVDAAPDFAGSLSDVAPALLVQRIVHPEAPNFAPKDVALVQAFVSMNGGRSVATVGFDASQSALPDEAVLAFFADVEFESQVGSELASVATGAVPVLNEDARAIADVLADQAGVTIPWAQIDETPSVLGQTVDDATLLMEEQLAAAQRTIEETTTPVVDPAMDEIEAQSEAARKAVDDATAPILQQAQDEADRQVAEVGAIVSDTMADVDALTAPLLQEADTQRAIAEAEINKILAELAPHRDAVDELVQQTTDDANTEVAKAVAAVEHELEPVKAIAAEQKAAAFAAAVDANVAVGKQKNFLRYTAGALVAEIEGTELPEAPDAPAPVPTPETPEELRPLAGAIDDTVADGEATAGGARAATTASSAQPGTSFKVQVRTIQPQGDIVVLGGVSYFDADGNYVEGVAAYLTLENPGDLLNVTVAATDGVTARIDSTDATTLSGIVIRDAVAGGADVTFFGIGPLPEFAEFSYVGTQYAYEASGVIESFDVTRVRFDTHADFVAWTEGAALTAGIVSVGVKDIPRTFGATIAGANAEYEASDRLGALSFVKADFVNGRLDGDLVYIYVESIPTEWTISVGAGGASAAFNANGPIGVVEALRTNGPFVAVPSNAFAVSYKVGAAELAHVRVLNVRSVSAATGPGGSFFGATLDGGYPFMLVATRDRMSVFGVVYEMPSTIGLALYPSNGIDARITMAPASSKGLYAQASLPQLGGKTAVLAVTNLPASMRIVLDSRIPSVSYSATHVVNGITLGVVDAAGRLGAVAGAYQIPTAFYFGLQKFGSGLPNIAYSASASTLDILVYVDGDIMGVFPGHALLWLENIPKAGLSFGASGSNYHIRAYGDRLTRLYMDVGYRFSGTFNYARDFANSWWLYAGARVNLAYAVNIHHFVVNLVNLRSLDVRPSIPMIDINVDGIMGTYFDLSLYANLYASAWAYLLRWIPVFSFSVSWYHNGPFPLAFTTWSYSWFYWTFLYFLHPVICGWHWGWSSWINWGMKYYYITIGLRLPTNFYTTVNGFGVAYGSASFFLNPGGIIPGAIIYGYALARGFDFTAWTWTRTVC